VRFTDEERERRSAIRPLTLSIAPERRESEKQEEEMKGGERRKVEHKPLPL
jgi:hypothetical protein